ncbi:MAG: tetratricopeptide repeat protein [Phycisphaerae bacterium]|nr:tetratricopeptide repeat protein [Phycisphaerae bacterium]
MSEARNDEIQPGQGACSVVPAPLPARTQWLLVAGVFALAVFVRLVHVHTMSGNPTFRIPIVDAAGYHDRARSLAEGEGMPDVLFWQPPLYPILLAGVYRLSNSSIVVARIVQCVLGGMTCVLTYWLGRRIFDWRVALAAALAVALYGPLIFFETELVAAGWATFWAVVLLLLLLRAADRPHVAITCVLGVVGALSVQTRPEFLPFLTVAGLWLIVALVRRCTGAGRLAVHVLAGLIGFALVTIPMACLCHRATGQYAILPASGGLNLFLGNNPDTEATLRARPGPAFKHLTELPDREGIHGFWEQPPFFRQKVIEYARTQPLAFVKGLTVKALECFNSREIPRTFDVYVYRAWSVPLRWLTWKFGPFGFPFGVVLPLAVVGVVCHWRRVPVPMLLLLVLFPLAMIAVFAAARFRVPIIPALCVLAAAGALTIADWVRACRYRPLVAAAVGSLVILAATSLPGPFVSEENNYAAEMYFLVGEAQLQKHAAPLEALSAYRMALRLNPRYVDARISAANVLRGLGKADEAIQHAALAVQLDPEAAAAHNNLALALIAVGNPHQALPHAREAVRIEPDDALAHHNLGFALDQAGQHEEAIVEYGAALVRKPDFAETHYNLAGVLETVGRTDEAIRHYREAIRLHPERPEPAAGLAWVLATRAESSAAEVSEAVALAEQAFRASRPYDAGMLDTLAAAYGAAGRFPEAVDVAQRAQQIATATRQPALARAIRARLAEYQAGRPHREPAPATAPASR